MLEAHVRIRRVGESPVEVGTTDSLGEVTFAGLLPGRYDITSLRLLNADETARINEADSALSGVNAAPRTSKRWPVAEAPS